MSADLMPFTYEGADLKRLPRAYRPSRDAVGRYGFVYVIEFGTGMIKVGSTRDARHRMMSHASEASRFGAAISRVWLSPIHPRYVENESSLIAQVGDGDALPASGREYFTECTFAAVIEVASRLDFAPLDAVEIGGRLLSGLHATAALRNATGFAVSNDSIPPLVRSIFHPDRGSVFREIPAWSSVDDMSLDDLLTMAKSYAIIAASQGISERDAATLSYLEVIGIHLELLVKAEVHSVIAWALEAGRSDLTRPWLAPDDYDEIVRRVNAAGGAS